MKIENEVTGEIVEIKENYVGVRLYIAKAISDSFAVDIEGKEIVTMLDTVVKNILNIENTFEAYLKLIKDLGLELPEIYIKHWIPSPNDKYFCIDSTGEVYSPSYYDEVSCSDNKRIENFNMFPTRELAEKGKNLSKLGRLILLWQYANDCVHTPYWSSTTKNNFCLSLDIASDKIGVVGAYLFKRDCIYFKTRKQAEAFVKMYNKESIRLMSIK